MPQGIAQFKSMFFDAPAVQKSADRGTRKVLSKFGAYVRTTARQSIRTRKSPSPVGSPPSSHTGKLKKFIFFGYDPVKKSVIVGPAKLDGTQGPAPEALEKGGTSRALRRRRGGGREPVTIHVGPRPFMRPAFEKQIKNLPSMWANSITP